VEDSLRLASNWPHAAKDAVQLIADTIRFNGGLGAEDEKGDLLGTRKKKKVFTENPNLVLEVPLPDMNVNLVLSVVFKGGQ